MDILMTYLAGELYLRRRREESKKLFQERLEQLNSRSFNDPDAQKTEGEQLEMPLPKPGIPELLNEEHVTRKGGK